MNAPERIYGVSHSQLSVSRHFGGCKFNGHFYKYDAETDCLIRDDVVMADEQVKKKLRKQECDKWMSVKKDMEDRQDWMEF